MEVQLVVASGSKSGQVIPIAGPKFIIGRADDCHLKPRSDLISRYHCALVVEDDYVAIRDLGSKNGVFLNGERVSMENELKNSDKLSVGPLEFFVHITVPTKAAKKSKVESVEQAVSRTVEIQADAMSDQKESEISDWLLASGESEQDHETKTFDASELLEMLRDNQSEPSEPKESEKTKGSGGNAPNTREAAANLLRNFFKGGR